MNHSELSTSLRTAPSTAMDRASSLEPDPRTVAHPPVRTIYKSMPLRSDPEHSAETLAPKRDLFWCLGDEPVRWEVSLSVQILSQLRRLLHRPRSESQTAQRHAA